MGGGEGGQVTIAICGTVTQACTMTMTELHNSMTCDDFCSRMHNVDGDQIHAVLHRMHFVLVWCGEGHLKLTA